MTKIFWKIVSFIYLFENGLPYEILVDLGVSNEQISILKKGTVY